MGAYRVERPPGKEMTLSDHDAPSFGLNFDHVQRRRVGKPEPTALPDREMMDAPMSSDHFAPGIDYVAARGLGRAPMLVKVPLDKVCIGTAAS